MILPYPLERDFIRSQLFAGGSAQWVDPGAYPASAAVLASAIGGGTWSHAWNFDEASGTTITALFGAQNLTLTTDTGITYDIAGEFAWSKKMKQASGTATATNASCWTTSSRALLVRFSIDVGTPAARNIASVGDVAIQIGVDGKLWVATKAWGSAEAAIPSYAFVGDNGRVSTFVYDDGLNHSILCWIDTTAGNKKLHVATDMEYFVVYLESDFAATNNTLRLFSNAAVTGMNAANVNYSYVAIATSATGLSSSSLATLQEYLTGAGFAAPKTAWPTASELATIMGFATDPHVFVFTPSALPVESSEGASFDSEDGAGDAFYDVDELVANTGGVNLFNKRLQTPVSGAGSVPGPSTAAPAFAAGIVRMNADAATTGNTQFDVLYRGAASDGWSLVDQNSDVTQLTVWGATTAGSALPTGAIQSTGLRTLIGSQISASERYAATQSAAATNTTNIGNLPAANARMYLGEAAASNGLITGSGTPATSKQTTLFAFYHPSDAGDLTSTANALARAKTLHNWFKGATLAPRQQMPRSNRAWKEWIGGNGGDSESMRAYDFSYTSATTVIGLRGIASVDFTVGTGQTNPALAASGYCASSRAVAFTDSSTVGLRSASTFGFQPAYTIHFSFRMAAKPAANRCITHAHSGTTLVWKAEVTSDGYLEINVVSNTAASATAQIAVDHCDGEWHDVVFTTHASPTTNIKVASDLGYATAACASGTSFAATSVTQVFGGAITGGASGIVSAACDIAWFAYASTAGTLDPRPNVRNWRDRFGKSFA